MPSARDRAQKGAFVSLVVGACLLLTTACGGDNDDALIDYDCSAFPSAATSPYVLPWTIGHTYTAIPHAAKDTNHKKYAVDILMPIGTPLLAIESGVVVALGEQYEDTDHTPGHENFVIVRHADGTAAGYGHLTNMGVVVEVGDEVEQGDLIGYSGHTGNSTEPHLHFDIIVNCDVRTPINFDVINGCSNTPLSFRNTNPTSTCGLRYGTQYTATPY
jgi:murein DD-endopeptidase MepM/ murein hydrolase activator NlpD